MCRRTTRFVQHLESPRGFSISEKRPCKPSFLIRLLGLLEIQPSFVVLPVQHGFNLSRNANRVLAVIMMEESGDDANGDSTFEFVGVKESLPLAEEAHKQQGMPATGDDAPHPTAPIKAPAPVEATVSSQQTIETVFPPPATSAVPAERLSASMYPPASTVQHSYGAVPAPPTLLPTSNQASPLATMYAPVAPPPPVQTYQHATPGYSSYYSYEAHTPAGIQSLALSLPTDYEQQGTGSLALSQPSNAGGMWGWFSGNDFLSKVAEKAKNSVDSVITTLDPGMKEYIYSGGDISIVVASDKEVKVVAIREAFQRVFGRASISGVAAQPSNMAAQPVGFAAGLKAAEDRIISLQQAGRVHPSQPLVAVESFLVELTPDCWYDVACLVLRDGGAGISLHTFSQATPVPAAIASELQDRTPPDYPLRWSGFSVTIGEVAGVRLGVARTQWHEVLGGIPRSQLLLSSACTLATMYKAALHR